MQDYINKIICADCLDILKQLPDKSVDLVLTDPPYGIGDKLLVGGKTGVVKFHEQYANSDWEDVKPNQSIFEEIFRISRNQVIFGGNYFNLPPTRGIVCWDKNIGTPYNFSHWEMAWTSFDCPAKKFVCVNDLNKQHPTQKPLKLMKWCLESYSQPDDIILDCFAGSGSTCVAAELLGRKWIGIEISPEYCKIAEKRVQEAREQFALFKTKT